MTAIHYFIMYFCLLMCRKTHLHNETDQNMLEKLTWVKVPWRIYYLLSQKHKKIFMMITMNSLSMYLQESSCDAFYEVYMCKISV